LEQGRGGGEALGSGVRHGRNGIESRERIPVIGELETAPKKQMAHLRKRSRRAPARVASSPVGWQEEIKHRVVRTAFFTVTCSAPWRSTRPARPSRRTPRSGSL